MACHTRLAAEGIAADRELAHFLGRIEGQGAVVSFVGLARPAAKSGERVESLFLDHYPGMTERSLRAIAEDGMARFEVADVAVVHRCGSVAAGEAIVFVAAASLHRREAFLAADYLMDRLKTDAMFWKREEGDGDARWIEPTDRDHADAARWSA